MGQFFAVLLVSLFGTQAIAQQNFEGKITYSMAFPGEEKITVLDVFYGNQRIKVLVKPDGLKPNDKEDLMLDFKNGLVYKITNHTKTYKIDSLKKSPGDLLTSIHSLVAVPAKNSTRAGHKSSAFTLPAGEAAVIKSPAITLWYADSLFFPVPLQYASVEMCVLFTNGKSVGFGMQLTMPGINGKMENVELVPLKVEAQKVADSILDLPAGYSFVTNELDTTLAMDVPDSVIVAADTMALPSETIDKPGTQKQKPAKQKIKTKSKTPIRKPGE